MRALALVALLVFAVACQDTTSLEPSTGDAETIVAAEKAINPRWEVEFTLSYSRTVDPGEAVLNAGGILHTKELVNEFNLTGVMRRGAEEGEVLGLQYFIGQSVINTNKGKGNSRARPARFVISESPLGAGTWECKGTFKIEPSSGGGFYQSGQIAGCHGTEAFEGMRMKLYGTNKTATPFLFSMWGEIW
jgi:hypothetical protein